MAPNRRPLNPKYDLHPSVRYLQKVIAGMSTKTGRSLEEWIDLVNREAPPEQAACQLWLKKEHKLGTNYAAWIAARAAGIGWEDGDPESYLRIAPIQVDALLSGRLRLSKHMLTIERNEGLARRYLHILAEGAPKHHDCV